MEEKEMQRIVQRQRAYFLTGATRPVERRIRALTALQAAVQRHEEEIAEAVRADLGKAPAETYMCETGMVQDEIRAMLRHVRRYAKEQRVRTPLSAFPAASRRKPSPYGVTLILSPWNYPFLLTLDPLVDALAAGNTAVVKPSAYSPHTSAVIGKLLSSCFPPEYVAVVTGGRAENTALLSQHFDKIFFTGSPAVGREVMRRASEHLTPVTLELGGKSPCIVEKSANLKLAARRIVFGKFLNCGQTCVAPDYVCCDASVREPLITAIKKEMIRQFGKKPLDNPDYGKIINEKHFNRILGLIDREKVIAGGAFSRRRQKIAPTLLDPVSFDDPVMQEEIFGPVLPILTYTSLDEAIAQVNSLPHPLALYLFTKDPKVEESVLSSVEFGGACVNDTVMHLANHDLPFGGVGESGMGAYHGKAGFETFSHTKSILDRGTWIDPPLRYHPYRKLYGKIVRLFLR